MSKHAHAESPLLATLADAARAQDDAILTRLAGQTSLTPEQVHDVRVAVKRLRAWWGLVATHIGEKGGGKNGKKGKKADRSGKDTPAINGKTLAAAQDKALAGVARRLSDARDRQVMGETLTLLRDGSRRDYEQEAVDRVRALSGLAETREQNVAVPADLEAVFRHDRDQWAALPAEADDKTLLEKGYGRFYSRARQAGFEAIADSHPENWHRFRKRVKAQLYQLDPLADRLETSDIRLKDLNKLARRLGELHDLHVLDRHLREIRRNLAGETKSEDKQSIAHVRQMIGRRESDCLEDCEKRTRRFFSLKPKAFRQALVDQAPAMPGG